MENHEEPWDFSGFSPYTQEPSGSSVLYHLTPWVLTGTPRGFVG